MTNPDTEQAIDELLYKYGEELTDVQHIKLRKELLTLIKRERLAELKRAIRQGYISGPLRHKVDRRIAKLEQSLKEQRNRKGGQ